MRDREQNANDSQEALNTEIQKLMRMLQAGTSAALTVEESARQLREAGFQELDLRDSWGLNHGNSYYFRHNDTTLLAFTIGEKVDFRTGFRMAAAHTDYPCLRVKPNPDLAAGGYSQINVEVYGGPILNTWLDRPLGISGRVALKSQQVMNPTMKLIDIKKPLMVIPNLAIHFNKEVNKGVELNRQTDMLPIVGMVKDSIEEKKFMEFLAQELKVEPEDILDYELWVDCLEDPVQVGLQGEFLVSPRLDNLTSVQALLSGLIQSQCKEGINLIALFDHEEIGSRTKQGAGSLLLLHVMEKICDSLARTPSQTQDSIYSSMLLSVDVAQGSHPNHLGKMDPTNRPVLGGGFCIKEACAQSYATDCRAVAIAQQICLQQGIPYQKFVNRSDVPGGGTLGAILSGIVPIPTVDVGIPLLAMHSAVETMGVEDQLALTDFVRTFFDMEG